MQTVWGEQGEGPTLPGLPESDHFWVLHSALGRAWSWLWHPGHKGRDSWQVAPNPPPPPTCLEGSVIPDPRLGFHIKRRRHEVTQYVLWKAWECVQRWIYFEADEAAAANSSLAWVPSKVWMSPGNLFARLYIFAKFVNLDSVTVVN